MSKYRIIKLGGTETYIVQQRFLRYFWLNRMGSVIPISLKEAREYKKMFEDWDIYR